MNRKIIAVFVSLLFISTIPTVIGDISKPDSEDEIIRFRAILLQPDKFHFHSNHRDCFFAVRLVVFYNCSSRINREVNWFKWISIKPYIGRMYEVRFGLLYLFGGNYLRDLKIIS